MVTRRPTRRQRGAVLLIFMILVVMAGLAFLVAGISPEATNARRERQTQEAMAMAREALIGYALRYRDEQAAKDLDSGGDDDRAMYGYLPLPDLGSSRNQNVDPNCRDADNNPIEGCDANTFTGIAFDANGIGPTVVGRFPWRTLGTGPLRDNHGECLWLIVSSLHSRIQGPSPALPPMNWDTLGQIDIVVANGSNALVSALASAHDRPVAVIFSPGPPLPGQDRSTSETDDVSQCGGNYDAKNYLDPAIATALGGITNYLAGTNGASGVTGDSDPGNDPDAAKGLSTRGKVFASGSAFLPSACQGNNCTLVANDIGLPVTSDVLFGAIRKSSHFRTDINAMLDRMVNCLRDHIYAGSTPSLQAPSATHAEKSVGRIPGNTCYDDNQNPLGYYSHYKDQVFVSTCPSGACLNVTVDGTLNSCAGALLFAGQRGTGQQRITATDKNTPSNYLENPNLASFITEGQTTFTGPSQFTVVSSTQTARQDIVRCIPSGASFTEVTSPTLAAQGFGQLVAYDAATRTLTLGKEGVTTGAGATASALFGCGWLSNTHALGSGLRTYFTFQFKKVGTSVGSNGFVFALADAMKNNLAACGAAGSHLGYSGDNGITPKIAFPKIGIEFDQSRNTGFSENVDPTLSGRNDPCGVSSCGGTAGYNSHAAIVYWGHEAANATDSVTLPNNDDNAHGFPTAGSLPGATRPPPRSHADPATEAGIEFVNLRGYPDNDYDSKLYYVRVEVTPARNVNASAAELSNTSVKTEVWIEGDAGAVNQIAALRNTTRPMRQLYADYLSTLNNTSILYDVAEAACGVGGVCPSGQTCGTDNICYRPALKTVQLGFTGSQRTTDQEVTISDFFATWLP
ncbi:MAG: hypothetical protein Q8O34_14885 [Rhodocyclaceae bacterium]|nr:hypothetical protein [Rhodocyclaceae bacterium]